jgi:hypothetical protein
MKKPDAALSATLNQPGAQANYIVKRQFRTEKTVNAKVEIEFASRCSADAVNRPGRAAELPSTSRIN